MNSNFEITFMNIKIPFSSNNCRFVDSHRLTTCCESDFSTKQLRSFANSEAQRATFIMSKKRHNAKGKKKEKQLRRDTPSGSNDSLILERNSTKSLLYRNSIVLFFSSAVAVLAIVLWQYYNTGSTVKYTISSTTSNTSLSELFRIACKKTKLARCEKGVFEIIDETRSIRTRKSEKRKPLIKRGQLLLEIPRTMQITTIDALRDPLVNNILRQNPRHPESGKPLHPKAFLALFLSFQLHEIRMDDIGNNRFENHSPHEHVRRAYLEYLPTHRDFLQFHPVLRKSIGYFEREDNAESIDPLSPSATLTDHLVDQYFRSFLSEYEALRGVSIEFERAIAFEDWITSRLIVNTRSFNSDPLTESDMSNEELDSYRPFLDENDTNQESSTSSSFYDKCRQKAMRSCMVPLLDAFDHDPKENIGWEFRGERSSFSAEKSFITYATKDISSDSDMFDSYFRSRPDPFVFAQYGFVTADGLGERAALLAPYHRLLAEEFENEKSFISSRTINRDDELEKYIAFKDGYESCDTSNYDDFEAKQRKEFEAAKFEALKAISNIVNSWVAILPSRNDDSDVDLGQVLSTCRLVAMTHRDYGGRATEMLQTMANSDFPEGYQFQVSSDEKTSEGLEYRAIHVLERLASEMLSRVAGTLASITSLDVDEVGVETLHQKLELGEIENSKWGRSSILVLLGEMETLTKLCEDVQDYKQKLLSNKVLKSDDSAGVILDTEDYFVRSKPC